MIYVTLSSFNLQILLQRSSNLEISTRRLDNFRFMNFWGMDQWKNSSSYKPHFIRKLWNNLIRFKVYINISIFCGVEQKIIVLNNFISLASFFFWETRFCAVYVKNNALKQIFVEGVCVLYSQFFFFCIIG